MNAMKPEKLAALFDRHGTDLETWPAASGAAARALLARSEAARRVQLQALRLDALLRAEPSGPPPDPARVEQVIALTMAMAARTPQRSPTGLARARAWLVDVGLLCWLRLLASEAMVRYGLPVAVALVAGVLVGHASVDQAAYGALPAGVDSLMSGFHATELFGL